MPSSSCQMKMLTGSSASMNFSSASAHPSTHQRKVGAPHLYWGTRGVLGREEGKETSFGPDIGCCNSVPRDNVDTCLPRIRQHPVCPCIVSKVLYFLSQSPHRSCDEKGLDFRNNGIGQMDMVCSEGQGMYLTVWR